MREIKIAKILRPHGIKGGLKVSPLIDDIPFSSFGKVILGKAKIDTKITKIQPLKQFLIVYVDAVNDCNTAETFRNQYIMIDREKFVENFVRRFAESATLSRTYRIRIYDINEMPPKVSLEVSSSETTGATGEILEFDITNRLDAILEVPY